MAILWENLLTCRNYAKSHPELCILAVNTFVQDSEDPNPLVRALAIRTMGCIRVDKMVDYLGEPLRKCLKVPPVPSASYISSMECASRTCIDGRMNHRM